MRFPTQRCRCGVYRYAHEQGRGCGKFHLAGPVRLFRLDHGPLLHHVEGWLWRKLSEPRRWDVANWMHDRRPDLCWCDMVMAVLFGADECACEQAVPWRVSKWVPGMCYCGPPIPAPAPSGGTTGDNDE